MDIFLEVLDKLSSWLSLLPRISAKNIVEIAIISFLVYELLVWTQKGFGAAGKPEYYYQFSSGRLFR